MHILQVVGSYLSANKEWLFSGAGVVILSSLASGLIWFARRGHAPASGVAASEEPSALRTGFDRVPRLEFADGIVAEVALIIELRIEHFWQFYGRFKTIEALHATFTPRIHVRLAQLMEVCGYEEAKRTRRKVEKQLMAEFSPQYRECGVCLLKIGIGTFVRRD